MENKPIICFIDDSDFEHALVREEIAPQAPRFEFVQAKTFEEACQRLSERIPALFLLDLWGQDPSVASPSITPRQEVERKVAGFPGLDQVYAGLEGFSGDVNNEYLKRFFTIVDCWRHLFEEVCARVGQNREYGLYNLEQARKRYPGVPAVFYTRKSLINDAVALFKAAADGLFIKPTGSTDEETRSLTRAFAPALLRDIETRILPNRP